MFQSDIFVRAYSLIAEGVMSKNKFTWTSYQNNQCQEVKFSVLPQTHLDDNLCFDLNFFF